MSIDGSISLNFPTLSGSAATGNTMDGAVTLEGSEGLASTLPSVSATLLGSALADGQSFMPELAVAGSLEPAQAWTPGPELDADALAGTVAEGAIGLPLPLLAGGIDDALLLPALTLAASGQASALVTGALALPQFALSGSLAPPLALAALSVDGVLAGGNIGSGDAVLAAPAVAAEAVGGAQLVLPSMALDAGALAGTVAAGQAALAPWQVQGSQRQNTVAQGELAFTLLAVAGQAASANRIEAEIRLAQPVVAALATSGATGRATLALPLVAVHANGYSATIGSALIELPALLVAGAGAGTPAAARSVIALNTQLAAVTLYDALAPNSLARFAGVTLAATADGIVALTGDTDLGTAISASVVAGVSDYGSDSLKRIIAGYVGYRAGGDMDLTLITDEHAEFTYRLAPRRFDGALHPSRVKFGRGVDGRYWQWKLANRDGADFTLDALGLDIETLARKIG